MPIGPFELEILQLLAKHRNPESHIGGATVLNQDDGSPRASEDIDVFHDTVEALKISFDLDCTQLSAHGYEMKTQILGEHFRRALIRKGEHSTKLEWVYDTAFRFFPVEPDVELGYRLNYWDAATNKILAGAGRAQPRDYVDMIHMHQHRLSLGALIWAAAGKDEGLSPSFIIEEMSRVQRYRYEQFGKLKLHEKPDLPALKQIWIEALHQARQLVNETLLEAPLGCLFLNDSREPVTPTAENWSTLQPHFGSVRGAWPRVVEE
ncbi:MAG: hypothetical protein AAF571_15450 [Verrucomicrobiota bacterium]